MGSKTYRIPALYTLNDGSVIAAADMRYDHGSVARIRYVHGSEYYQGRAPFIQRIGTGDQPTFYYAYRPID